MYLKQLVNVHTSISKLTSSLCCKAQTKSLLCEYILLRYSLDVAALAFKLCREYVEWWHNTDREVGLYIYHYCQVHWVSKHLSYCTCAFVVCCALIKVTTFTVKITRERRITAFGICIPASVLHCCVSADVSTKKFVKMSLEVRVKSASNLPNVERWSKSDPMTVLLFQGGHLLVLVCSFCGMSPRKKCLNRALAATRNPLRVFSLRRWEEEDKGHWQ